MKHIGESFRFIRQSMGMEQKELSERCGLSRSYISQVELGVRDPSWSTIVSICTGLGIDISMATMLFEANRPAIKPLAPIVYAHLLAVAQENTK